jgi:shikimate kinase
VIYLVGPGGAGKSTVGSGLASRLDLPFIDLDLEFMEHVGDISHHIDHRGYNSYASENVLLCLSILATPGRGVIALSSGFMAYPESVHPAYPALRSYICKSSTTFVLLPSLDLETCVDEIVRRQVARPIGRSLEREEAVIRERHAIYMAIPATKIETMRPVTEIVEQMIAQLPPDNVFDRSRRSEFLMVPPLPLGGPVDAGVRRLYSRLS